MRLGIGSYSLSWNIAEGLSHEALLDEAVRLGVQSVQFCDNLPLERLHEDAIASLEDRASEHGIVIEPGTRGIDRERLLLLAGLARRFGCGFVRLVVDGPADEPTVDTVVERLRFWREEVSDVTLAIENHDRFSSRTLTEIVERLGPERYGVCLDTANSLGCLEGTEQVVRTLAPYTVNLHIKDVRIQRAWHNMGFTVTGTAAGKGQIDVPWVLEQVKDKAESAIIEIWADRETPDISPSKKERLMLAESVSYVKPVLAGYG